MGMSRRSKSVSASVLIFALALPGPTLASPSRSPAASPDDGEIVHVLNRLGYGPRTGDVERVRAMGVERWIDRQLKPREIPDPEPERALASLPTLRMSAHELQGKYDLPREAKQEIRRQMAEGGADASEPDTRERRRELMTKYGGQLDGPPREVVRQLQAAKVIRAALSERQLDEVVVDFWLNHFNVYANKGPERFLVGAYERDTIRPHAWGRFEDLLRATAESPAMLFYLDNWLSSSPSAPERSPRLGRQFRRAADEGDGQPPRRRRGLNENYARELMELHTLGVEGGYTQRDVTEVARCFTGWTIDNPRGTRGEPHFIFRPRLHDPGDKTVLGHRIRDGGRGEGLEVLHLLATHPSTAHFIAQKLARRFVSDEPPAALVDRAAEAFRRTDGDIREVLRTIVTSPEMRAPEARAAKVKTPFELVVSALRASGAHISDARGLGRYLEGMGMPLYLQQPPTGYKDTAAAWVSTSGLLARLNFALDLAGNRIQGIEVEPERLAPHAPDARAFLQAVARALLPNGLTDATRQSVEREGEHLDASRTVGLLLGSPEFQRR
jgi:uncharacterized protein (DUF1800 family)